MGKKMDKRVKESAVEDASVLLRQLIKKVYKNLHWEEGHEILLKRIERMAAVENKLRPLEKRVKKELAAPNPKDDDEIVRNFLSRMEAKRGK